MKDEIVVSESVQLGTVQATSPADIVDRASEIATVLAKVINDRKLFTVINGKKYVQVDGWNTLGGMIGVLPRETKSEKIDNGYLAFVELVRTTDGMIIGGASAICTREEKNWGKRDEYAIKSMATTRATGKAYRLGFSWIMNLAGYESTPAEEMIDGEFTEKSNDNGKKPEQKKAAPVIKEMNAEIQAAINHVGSDDKRYGDCTVEELKNKMLGITKVLNDKKRLAEHQIYKEKLEVVKLVLDYKK